MRDITHWMAPILVVLVVIYGAHTLSSIAMPKEIRSNGIGGGTYDIETRKVAGSTPDDDDGVGIKSPCIATYLQEMRRLGIVNGRNMSYAEWESALSQPPAPAANPRPFVVGVGPGTTATRSFALSANLLGLTILHFTLTLVGKGRQLPKPIHRVNVSQQLPRRLMKGERDLEIWNDVKNTSFVEIFEDYHGVFDSPWGSYALDVLRSFPNAKFIMTHRDPEEWYDSRTRFCINKTPTCAVPFLLRPLQLHMTDDHNGENTVLTREQAVKGFVATEKALKCMVGPDRFLKVDAWNPPKERGWLPKIASFLNVTLPPPESRCAVPGSKTSHLLTCERDANCSHCVKWLQAHPEWYDQH